MSEQSTGRGTAPDGTAQAPAGVPPAVGEHQDGSAVTEPRTDSLVGTPESAGTVSDHAGEAAPLDRSTPGAAGSTPVATANPAGILPAPPVNGLAPPVNGLAPPVNGDPFSRRPSGEESMPPPASDPVDMRLDPVWRYAEDPVERSSNTDMLGGFAGDVAEEPADTVRRRRRIRFAAVIGAAVVLLCLGVAFGPTAWALIQQRNTSIATPQQVAGLTLDESDNAKGTADYLKTAVETGVSFDSAVGAVYTDGGAESRSVIFVGGTGLFMTPDKQLRSLFDLLTDQTGGVDQVRPVPAGSLGGVMKCGITSTEDGSMAVCGWADHGSLAVALFPDRGVDESAGLMRQMRHAMQRRG